MPPRWQFLSAIRGHRLEALFVVAVTTSLRQGELLGLQWTDWDHIHGTLTIRRALQRVDGRPRRTHDGSVPAGRASAAHRRGCHRESAGAAAGACCEPVPIHHGERRANVRDRGLPRFRRSDRGGRRTADSVPLAASYGPSLLLAQGVHPRVVMEMLGHSTIALTVNTYSHVIPALERDAADRLNALLSS